MDTARLKKEVKSVLRRVKAKVSACACGCDSSRDSETRADINNQWKFFDKQEIMTEKLQTRVIELEQRLEEVEKELKELKNK